MFEHTSKLIMGSRSTVLEGRKIVLCVTGSVAAVECVAIARGLMRHGAEVFAVMSDMAQKIIHPYLLEWATGNPVVTSLTGQIEHVALAGKHKDHADLILVAPATANTIGKMAHAIDDTPVTTTLSSAIGAGIPIIVVPAMHASMYDHPGVIENIEKLREMGVRVLAPRREEAKAKIPKTETIIDQVIAALTPNDLEGRHFVITAGPTRGWIDRVRFVTNPSTGKMGIEIAKELTARGASVTLVIGPTAQEPPDNVEIRHVQTSEEMLETVLDSISQRETYGFISAAAVLDYVPEDTIEKKIESGKSELLIRLRPTKKIIEEVREKFKDILIVGFKVESDVTDEELERAALSKIDKGICDYVVANDAHREGVAFGTDTNEVLIVGPKGTIEKVPLSSKRVVAKHVVDIIAAHRK